MIDAELVNRKLLLIAKDVEALQGLADMTLDVFRESSINAVLAERYIERAVGRMIDINYHLLTESGQAPPPDYYQSFLQLAAIGVYAPQFAQRIASCAGLRNRIAHEYDDIDPRKLFDAVRQAVHDVPEYLGHVDAWLGR
ncbi:MAG: HepT-like ribonuclease domain-containing protein [Acidobacteriota bacterium]